MKVGRGRIDNGAAGCIHIYIHPILSRFDRSLQFMSRSAFFDLPRLFGLAKLHAAGSPRTTRLVACCHQHPCRQ